MANKDFQRDKPHAGQQGMGGQRKNEEEAGEPIQLPDDKSKMGQGKPGGGQQQGGQHQQGGGQHQQGGGGQHQGGSSNR